MVWWIWVSIGIVLAIGEALVPGSIFLLFFALAACLVGILVSLVPDISLSYQLLCFSITAVALTLSLRPFLLSLISRDDRSGSASEMIGQRGVCITDIPVGQRGKIELRGTCWNAINVGNADLAKGGETIVSSIEGLLVHVKTPTHDHR